MNHTIEDSLVVQAALTASEWIYGNYKDDAEAKRNLPEVEEFRITNSRATCSIEYCMRRIALAGPQLRSQKATLVVALKTPDKLVKRFLLLVFRGTVSLMDWTASVGMQPDEMTFYDEGLAVHSGFHNLLGQAIQGVCPSKLMGKELDDTIQEGVSGMVITGHSLGGALAQIASLKIMLAAMTKKEGLKKEIMEKPCCVTFAAPSSFKPLQCPDDETKCKQEEWITQLGKHVHNYVHNNDIVPRLPGHAQFIENVLQQQGSSSALKSWTGITPMQKVLVDLFRMFMDALPVLEGYIHTATTSFIGHAAARDQQFLSPAAAESYILEINSREEVQEDSSMSLAHKPDLKSCVGDHDIAKYRKYVERTLRWAEPAKCKLIRRPAIVPQPAKGLTIMASVSETLACSSKYKNTLVHQSYLDFMEIVEALTDQGCVAEAVKWQRESCGVLDFWDLHGFVVLRLRTKEDAECFLRADWEQSGWRTQQQEKEASLESHFGTMREMMADDEQEETEKFTVASKTALSDLWRVLNKLSSEHLMYTAEWNSLRAAHHLYQQLIPAA